MLQRRMFVAAAAAAAASFASVSLAAPVRAQAASPSHSQHSQQTLQPIHLPAARSSTPSLFSQATAAALDAPLPSPSSRTHTSRCSLMLSPAERAAVGPTGAAGAAGAEAAAQAAAEGARMTEKQASQCEEWKQKAINQSRKVNFMFRSLKRAGCAVDPQTFIHCTACDSHMNGALFHDADGYTATLMCGNRVKSYRTFETVLTHELIHAFDHCRAEIDPVDLRHHACMEVRAASLSGDCLFRNEIKLGNLSVTEQQPRCVRRRATISVMSNPSCADIDTARAAVEDVFERCYADTEPFKAIP